MVVASVVIALDVGHDNTREQANNGGEQGWKGDERGEERWRRRAGWGTKKMNGMMWVRIGLLSCLGSRTPEVKDTPFLGSVWDAKEAEERLLPGGFVNARELRASKHHRDTGSFTQVQAPRRLTALLLHVWIERCIMV